MPKEEFRIEEISNFRKDTSFFRTFVFTLSILFVVALVGVVIYYDSRLKAKEQQAWVIDYYQTPYVARRVNSLDHPDRFIEYERMLEELYATYFSADEDSWKQSNNLGLELMSQESGRELQLKYFEQERIENNVSELGWVYEAQVDSILWESDKHYPYAGYVIGKQRVVMPKRTVIRNLYIRFVLYNTQKRTKSNSWAAKVDEVEIINNEVIEVKKNN